MYKYFGKFMSNTTKQEHFGTVPASWVNWGVWGNGGWGGSNEGQADR